MSNMELDTSGLPVKILFINASPDQEDHTTGLLQKGIEGAASLGNVETSIYEFKGKEFYPCRGCDEYCLKNKHCVIKDSLHDLISHWLQADGVVWGVPVYSYGTPTQIRSFIDRFGEQIFKALWPDRLPWWRFATPVGTIASSSGEHGSMELEVMGLISHYILINALHVPGDGLDASLGVIGRYADGERTEDQPQTLEDAYRLGVRVTEMARYLKVGKLSMASSLPDVYWCSKETYITADRPVGVK
jgi:multimeric flavodoxin WrbA